MSLPAFRLCEAEPDCGDGQACLARYYAELDARFPEGFVLERAHDPDPALLRRPRGSFVIAYVGDQAVGCVALKGTSSAYSEIKRLWVDPEWRGRGLSGMLMREAEAIARALGARVLRLDTNRALWDAIALYRRWGWTEIARFNDDPYAHVFFEKPL